MPAFWAVAIAGIAAAGAGAVSASKTRKSNESLAGQARGDEEKRRKLAAREAERLIGEFNELREERPDVTIESFLSDVVVSLGNKEARDAFEKATKEDFENAQILADEASKNNVSVYKALLEEVSGGSAAAAIKKRNEIAFDTNEVAAFERAMQLRSTAIPAGTVRMDKDGRFIEGQRADRQVFQTAFEVSEQQRGLQFDRLSSMLGTDRDVAIRQQQKALEFMPVTSYTNTALNAAAQSRAAQAAYQAADEATQFSLIQGFLSSAFSNQTATPAFGSTAGADALTVAGLKLATQSLAQNNANKNAGTTGQAGAGTGSGNRNLSARDY